MSNLINNTTMKQKLMYTLDGDNTKTIRLDVTLKGDHHIDQHALDNLPRIISGINIGQYNKKS